MQRCCRVQLFKAYHTALQNALQSAFNKLSRNNSADLKALSTESSVALDICVMRIQLIRITVTMHAAVVAIKRVSTAQHC
jgi:hypothetical protein